MNNQKKWFYLSFVLCFGRVGTQRVTVKRHFSKFPPEPCVPVSVNKALSLA